MVAINITAPNTAKTRPGFLARLGDSILVGLTMAAESNSRLAKARRLQAMSDDQLAALGLKREDIARHVFSDLYYI